MFLFVKLEVKTSVMVFKENIEIKNWILNVVVFISTSAFLLHKFIQNK